MFPDSHAELPGKLPQFGFAFGREVLAAKSSNAGTDFFNLDVG
jgi:hypothetical protein